MNKKYLFVSEADKIQDLLFRSSKLREVTGGSQMLEKFCKDTTNQLAEKFDRFDSNIIISSGGSFRLLFDSKGKAEEFGEYLSELYRRDLGGRITVAEPVEVISEKKAIKQAQENLRKAKHSGKTPISIEQMPYMAICASCGIGIARNYKKRHEDEKENYLCDVCERKSRARDSIKGKGEFLSKFYSYIMNSRQSDIDFPKDADTIAELESRNYVAYIVADVNDMGVIFNSCDSFEELRNLSDDLSKVIQQSLAEPTKILTQKQLKESNFVPVLPLILGGDDVFTLIPAQWALDFTLRFCQEFERRMKQSLEEIGNRSNIPPTISVSIVICKGKFPYLLAHDIGEELLEVAKKTSKENKKSAISIKVISGNEIVKAPDEKKKFVAGFPAYSIEELKKLVEHRFKLKDLSGTRRAQLEASFHKAKDLQKDGGITACQRIQSEWRQEIEGILKRLEQNQRDTIRNALNELGDEKREGNWQRIDGSYHHKLPDLFLAWDFAYDLGRNLSKYEGVEE